MRKLIKIILLIAFILGIIRWNFTQKQPQKFFSHTANFLFIDPDYIAEITQKHVSPNKQTPDKKKFSADK